MEKCYGVPRSTHSLLMLDGFVLRIYMDARYWTRTPCPVCGKEFWVRRRELEVKAQRGEKPKVCSKSCVTKRMHQMNPHVAELARAAGRQRWSTNPPWLGKHHSEETKALLRQQGLARRAAFLALRQGNGTGLTRAEALVQPLLPSGFVWNYPVSLGKRQEGYPTNYKLDFADPEKKIGLEIDGPSHKSRVMLDQKKEAKLAELGWRVLRLSNTQIFQTSTTSALKELLTSLLGEAGY